MDQPGPFAGESPQLAPLRWWERRRTRLLGAFLLVTVAVAVIEVADVVEDYRQAERGALTSQTETAAALARASELFVLRYADLAGTGAGSLFEPSLTREARGRILAGILRSHPEIGIVALAGPDGRVVEAEPPDRVGLDFSDRDDYRRLLAGAPVAVSDLLLATRTQAPGIAVAAAGRGPDGALRGMVVIGLPVDGLARTLGLQLSGGAFPVVTDRTGRVVVHGAFPDLAWERRDFSRVPPVAEALAGRPALWNRLPSPVTGRPMLGALVPVPGLGWAVGVTQPVDAALAPARQALRRALAAVAVVMGLAVALALLLSARLSSPVAAVAAGVAALARGDLGHRVAVRGRSELGLLAEGFNAMAARLEHSMSRQQELNDRLGAANQGLRESEARLRLALEAGRMGTWDWNVATGTVRWSPGLEAIHGFAPGTFGGTFEAYLGDVHPEDRDRVTAAIARAVESGADHDVEYRIVRCDGTVRWVEGKGRVVRDEAGRVVGMTGACMDITERKWAEAERSELLAREQAARQRAAFLAEASTRLAASLDYEATLDSVARLFVPELGDCCFVDLLEADGSIRRLAVAHVDPAKEALAREMQRYPIDPDGPHPVATVLRSGRPEPVPEISGALLGAVARDAEHLRLLRELGLRSGIVVPMVARGRTLGSIAFSSAESGRGYGPGELALAEELARRAALAVDNARLYREAQEAVRAREAFLARAAHELRTPLTSALGTVRWLRRAMAGALKESPDSLAGIAQRNLEVMATLINNLLDASKLAAGRESLAVNRVALAELVRRSLEVVGTQAREKGVALRVSVPAGLRVPADPLKLEQVLVNLLANAVKFTPPGGEVAVEAEAADANAVIRVRDTGEGIAREHLERIFEPFFQANPGGARRPRGTGLGLAICRQIVALHGGTIRADSAGPGRGSTFTVQLPVTSVDGRAA